MKGPVELFGAKAWFCMVKKGKALLGEKKGG